MEKSSPYFTTEEAAKYLRFGTASAIRTLVYRGELEPFGMGSRHQLLFRKEDLDQFLQKRMQERRERIPVFTPRRRSPKTWQLDKTKPAPPPPPPREIPTEFRSRDSGELLRGAAKRNAERAAREPDTWGIKALWEELRDSYPKPKPPGRRRGRPRKPR